MLSSCPRSQSSPEFTVQQLKQLRAQCLVFLAIRNNKEPTKKHLEIALGESSAEGSSSSSGGGNRDETETGLSSSPAVFSVPTAVLPPPDPDLALCTLRLSSPRHRTGSSGPTRRIVRGGPKYTVIQGE